jgi:hypothetical protein
MLPVLNDGDEVRVRAARIYWPGQVLVYADPHGQVWVHRLLGFKPAPGGWRFYFKGDNVPKMDPPVEGGRIVGRVVARRGGDGERPLGGMDNFLRWMRSLGRVLRDR